MLPRLALTLAFATLVCPPSYAQSSQADGDGDPPAHVSLVEGVATLEREGRAENPLNMPLLSGDRLKTADGRVEVLFADGSTLHLDRSTTLDVQSDDLVRLIDGRLRLNILKRAEPIFYRVDSPSGSVRITEPGEYRLAMLHSSDETQLELAVVRGAGEIFTEQGTTPVRAGERAYASAGLAPSYAYTYNSANWDEFDRWSEGRRDTRLGVSTQYLPSDLQTYSSTFDEYGDWRNVQPYGYVWYPRVAVGWRPYYYGRWVAYPRYGWTWVGVDRFSWPTHHYGRWGFSSGVWFWIPARRWAPHYVSWAYAGNFVSWCPLGFDNRPLISINIFNVGRPHFVGGHRFAAWTIVSRSHFGRGWVHQGAFDWDRFDRNRRPHFQLASAAPINPNVAVPRGSAPVRWAGVSGNRAASRGNAPSQRDPSLPSTRGSRAAAADSGSRAVPRGNATSSREAWLPPSGGSRAAAGDSGSRAVPRGNAGTRSERPGANSGTRAPSRDTAVPRYTNRGDEIIRSQTARPSPRPSIETAPSTPARRSEAPSMDRGVRAIERAPSSIDRGPQRIDRSPAAGRTAAPSIDRGARAIERTPSFERTRPPVVDRDPSSIDRRPSGGRTMPQAIERAPRAIDRTPQTIDRTPRTIDRGPGGSLPQRSIGVPSYDRGSAPSRAIERPGGARVPSPIYQSRPAPAPRAIERPGGARERQAAPSAGPSRPGGAERAAPRGPSATPPRSGGNSGARRRGGGS